MRNDTQHWRAVSQTREAGLTAWSVHVRPSRLEGPFAATPLQKYGLQDVIERRSSLTKERACQLTRIGRSKREGALVDERKSVPSLDFVCLRHSCAWSGQLSCCVQNFGVCVRTSMEDLFQRTTDTQSVVEMMSLTKRNDLKQHKGSVKGDHQAGQRPTGDQKDNTTTHD